MLSLKRAIVEEVEAIPEEIVLSAICDYKRRLRLCIERNGHNVEFY